jgi:hypothetical protein
MIFKERIYLYAARSTPFQRWMTTGVVMLLIVAAWWGLMYGSWYRRYSTAAQEYYALEKVMNRVVLPPEMPELPHKTGEKMHIDMLLHAALRAGLSVATCTEERHGSERSVTLIVHGTFADMVTYLSESSLASGWCYQQGEWTLLPHDEIRAVLTGLCESHDHL